MAADRTVEDEARAGRARGRRAMIEARRHEITELVHEHRGVAIALFGSVVRGEDVEGSDVDFLVEFDEDSSLFDLLHLQDALEGLLGCPVDVVSSRALKPRDEHIRAEAVPL